MKIVVKLRANRGKKLRVLNSEITGQFTKFGHDVAWLLPLNLLKADLRSANLLSKQRVKVVPRDVCERLPFNLGNTWKIIPTNAPSKPVK